MGLTLNLDDTTALALFDFLSRALDEQNGKKLRDATVHDGELWAMNTLHGALEEALSVPFDANYRADVDAALEMLVVKSGAWPTTT